jgi:uncharacterized membrane protein YqiK
MQLMQIIGDRKVRLIPDILVGGGNGSHNGLVDGLLTMLLWNQTGKLGTPNQPQNQLATNTPESPLELLDKQASISGELIPDLENGLPKRSAVS